MSTNGTAEQNMSLHHSIDDSAKRMIARHSKSLNKLGDFDCCGCGHERALHIGACRVALCECQTFHDDNTPRLRLHLDALHPEDQEQRYADQLAVNLLVDLCGSGRLQDLLLIVERYGSPQVNKWLDRMGAMQSGTGL